LPSLRPLLTPVEPPFPPSMGSELEPKVGAGLIRDYIKQLFTKSIALRKRYCLQLSSPCSTTVIRYKTSALDFL
jgi:hypothetical protein